jgi:DNA-binding GntR family transcriptional regulator
MASVVADQLRRLIMTGQLLPDAQLRVSDLALNFKTAISPVREALNRLSSEGLVDVRDMRGFFVASASLDELREITQARCLLNELALRQSIEKGDEHWEEAVLLSYHRLGRVPRRTETGDPSSDWDEAHRVFHRSLTTGCGIRFLVDFCDLLFVKAERYRHLARLSPAASARKRDSEHKRILQAVVARRADEAVALLTGHFEATAHLSRAALNNSRSRILSRRGAAKA